MTESFFEITNLFEANTDGYTKYRIPGACVTPSGVALVHTEARFGRGSDWDAIDIMLRRSHDNGQTWEAPRKLIDHRDFGEGPLHNCNTIVDHKTGAVHVLFCFNYARAFYMKTADDGETFTSPVEITATFEAFRPEYDWGVIAIGLPNGIQLTSGRLFIPVWLSESHSKAHRPNRCAAIYSDDHGQTWQASQMIPDIVPNLNETCAVELEDGRVLMNMRNGVGVKRRVITTSADGTGPWTTPWLDPALLEPTCQGTIFRYSSAADRRSRILFSNPNNLEGQDKKGSELFLTRKNVTVKLSYDECQTWPISKVIEPGYSGYSALAVCPDGTIICAFERGRSNGSDSDDYLAVARFNLAWLTDGADNG